MRRAGDVHQRCLGDLHRRAGVAYVMRAEGVGRAAPDHFRLRQIDVCNGLRRVSSKSPCNGRAVHRCSTGSRRSPRGGTARRLTLRHEAPPERCGSSLRQKCCLRVRRRMSLTVRSAASLASIGSRLIVFLLTGNDEQQILLYAITSNWPMGAGPGHRPSGSPHSACARHLSRQIRRGSVDRSDPE